MTAPHRPPDGSQSSSRGGPAGETAPVLFLSNYFPPEVNALASRTWEHAREWTAGGGEVEVVAGPPHFPEGYVYEGYSNRVTRERLDGIEILRVPMYVTPNSGFYRRTLSYVSYMLSAGWHVRRLRLDPGVVVASSPQLFAGLAGWLVSRRLKRPFVLEIRDLWPESIVDVGAMRRGPVIRALEWLETRLYGAADHVVIVSPAFRAHIEARGVPADRITVIPNGVDLTSFEQPVPQADIEALRGELGLEGRFVASYIGTVGMAHGVEVLLAAARDCPDPDLAFLIVGAGSEWQRLRDAAETEGLDNLCVIEKQPRERIRLFYAASDVSIVHLKDREAFRKVIPSKMFEAMAMRLPIVLGVRGQAREILESAGAGIAVTPEDAGALLSAVLDLKRDAALRERLGTSGGTHAREFYDRRDIARRYWALLQRMAAGR